MFTDTARLEAVPTPADVFDPMRQTRPTRRVHAPQPTDASARDTAVFVDPENLLGQPYRPLTFPPGVPKAGIRPLTTDLAWDVNHVGFVAAQTRRLAATGPNDPWTYATCRTHHFPLRIAWGGGGRWLDGGHGKDAADNVLLDAIATAPALGVSRVVIASGDSTFTMAAHALKCRGIWVEVVADPMSLSRSLRLVADAVHYLPRHRRDAA